MKYFTIGIGAALLLLMSIGSANAQLVNFTVEGNVTLAGGSNIFGLSVGDTITANAIFDDSLISGTGTSLIDFSDPLLGIDLIITTGSGTYANADEVLGGAWLWFYNGVFDGLDYSASDEEFDSFNLNFTGTDLGGTWTTATLAPVPVPAALWLFGSGLIGLVGIVRRKTA